MKWTLYVRNRRTRRTTCRAAKEALVAIMMEGVGPGVKMEEMRSVKKVAMVDAGRGSPDVVEEPLVFGASFLGERYSGFQYVQVSAEVLCDLFLGDGEECVDI